MNGELTLNQIAKMYEKGQISKGTNISLPAGTQAKILSTDGKDISILLPVTEPTPVGNTTNKNLEEELAT